MFCELNVQAKMIRPTLLGPIGKAFYYCLFLLLLLFPKHQTTDKVQGDSHLKCDVPPSECYIM